MPISERRKEIKRRRHRRKKLAKLQLKAHKGSQADHSPIAEKVRAITPGAEVVIQRWELKNV